MAFDHKMASTVDSDPDNLLTMLCIMHMIDHFTCAMSVKMHISNLEACYTAFGRKDEGRRLQKAPAGGLMPVPAESL